MADFVKMRLEGAEDVQRELEKLAKKAGIVGEDFADYSAKVIQQTVIRNVQPFGPPAKAKKAGEKAVRAGLFAAFRPVHHAGKGVITSVGEARAHHRSVRNSKGRVMKGAERRKILHSVFRSYMGEQLAKVGKAKGSFSDESKRLGSRVPGWIKRWSGGGKLSRSRNRRGVVWSFDSNVDYTSSGHAFGEAGIKRVFRVKDRVLRNSLRGKLRRLGKL